MPFKKLHPHLKEKLAELKILVATPFQKTSIPIIKSGANVFCTASENNGKTTTLILTILNKLKCEEVGTAPRAIVLVENNDNALQLYNVFLKYTKSSSLRVYVANEREHIDLLKSEIFEGVDILISTPKTLHKLLLLEGVNTTQVKIFSIDDADFLAQKAYSAEILSITQSISKCQFVLYSQKMNPPLRRFENYFMQFAKVVSV